MTQRPKVMLGIPTMASMHTLLVMTILAWMNEARSTGAYDLSIYPTVNVTPVDNARNDIVKYFLSSDATHLLFVDADTIPPLDAIRRLLAHDKQVVSALVPIIEMDGNRNPWRKWNAVGMDDMHMAPNTGTRQSKGAGTACLMIKREVFEQMEFPYFRFAYKDDTGRDVFVSEDIHFTIQCLARGIKTYADTSIVCQHYKNFLF